MFLWGLTGWMYVVPQQHRLLNRPGSDGSLTVALNNSVFYLGIAAGGAIGGIVLHLGGPAWLAVPATGLGAVAAIAAGWGYRS
jgi:predicted MFS family arabinose efflux permease